MRILLCVIFCTIIYSAMCCMPGRCGCCDYYNETEVKRMREARDNRNAANEERTLQTWKHLGFQEGRPDETPAWVEQCSQNQTVRWDSQYGGFVGCDEGSLGSSSQMHESGDYDCFCGHWSFSWSGADGPVCEEED